MKSQKNESSLRPLSKTPCNRHVGNRPGVSGAVLAVMLICPMVSMGAAPGMQQDEIMSSLAADVEGADVAGFPSFSWKDNGTLRSFFTVAGSRLMVPGTTGQLDAESIALSFLEHYRAALGVYSEHTTFVTKSSKEMGGLHCIALTQDYEHVPVYGSHVMVHVDAAGGVRAVLSDIMVNTAELDSGALSMEPSLSPEQAIGAATQVYEEAAANEHGAGDAYLGPLEVRAEPVLKVFDPAVVGLAGRVRLAWEVQISDDAGVYPEGLLVDAHTGQGLFRYLLHFSALDRDIYDHLNNKWLWLLGILKRQDTGGYPNNAPTDDPNNPYTGGEEISDVDDAWDFFADAYDFYADNHDRDGFDDNGTTIIARTRYCDPVRSCPFQNAAWAPEEEVFIFGDGFAVDDIVGHEFTHAVTQYESQLAYTPSPSGAINECFSDVWGEFVDLGNGAGTDTEGVRWLIGEDLSIGAGRDMADPPQYDDPDRLGSPLYYTGGDADIYAHTNCGVGNKLCALLTDGGTFNGYSIQGQGIDVVADMFYHLQTVWLGSSSDYYDLGNGLVYFADELGYSYKNTVLAVRAVEVNTDQFFGIKDDGGTWLLQMDNHGDVYVPKGALVTNASSGQLTPSANIREFVVKKSTGEVVGRLRSDTGDFYIKGAASYVANLTHINQTEELAVSSGGAYTYSLIDKNGNLKYRRWLID